MPEPGDEATWFYAKIIIEKSDLMLVYYILYLYIYIPVKPYFKAPTHGFTLNN